MDEIVLVICAYFYIYIYIYIRRPCFFDLFGFALKNRHAGSSYKKNKVCMCLLVLLYLCWQCMYLSILLLGNRFVCWWVG